MKKIFTLFAVAVAALSAYADDTYVTTTQVNIDGTDYVLTWGEAQTLTNNDTSASWWSGGTDTYALEAGDFALRFTWKNTSDVNYSDVVAELYDATPSYWDWTVGDAGGWGDLYTACTDVMFEYYEDGEGATQVVTGSSNGEFGGTYELLMVRKGTTLLVQASILRSTTGVTAQYYVTSTGFTTDAVTAVLTGNPYFVEDITIAEGEISLPTAISTIEASSVSESSDVYSISGVKVNSSCLTKGVYIQNGRKFIVK